ncbi:unnamed protein product [Choristocarpus tenellus]
MYDDFREVRAHTAILQQCTLNSYVVHPWQKLRGRTKGKGRLASYVRGDFILHFAGKKGRVKQVLVDHYYSIAKRFFKDYQAGANVTSAVVSTSHLTPDGGGTHEHQVSVGVEPASSGERVEVESHAGDGLRRGLRHRKVRRKFVRGE